LWIHYLEPRPGEKYKEGEKHDRHRNFVGCAWRAADPELCYNVPTIVDTSERIKEMVTVGVRELKQQASELIRLVRETGSEVQVTLRGQVVALLIPVTPSVSTAGEKRSWANLDTLSAEIGARWPKGVSAAQAIAEDRR
jgi:prevent-host-death family protein